jgi:cell division protease FtsH
MLSGAKLGDRIEGNLAKLLRRTEGLLTKHRVDVLRVTHALETHKTLTGDDVIAVIEGDAGPTVDGRGYHEPTFIVELEQYHQVVVGAHKEHEKVTIELPRANGDTDEPQDAIPLPPPPVTAPVPAPVPAADMAPRDPASETEPDGEERSS